MMTFIILDAYSKWLEVKITNTTSLSITIRILDELFTTYSIPITVVSNNGTLFTSTEFEEFLLISGVNYHKLTAPYHPSTNGQAKRYVQIVKDALKAVATTLNTLQRNLNEFLRQYRRTSHTTMGQPSSQQFLGRNVRTCLDLVQPAHKKIAKIAEPRNRLHHIERLNLHS